MFRRRAVRPSRAVLHLWRAWRRRLFLAQRWRSLRHTRAPQRPLSRSAARGRPAFSLRRRLPLLQQCCWPRLAAGWRRAVSGRRSSFALRRIVVCASLCATSAAPRPHQHVFCEPESGRLLADCKTLENSAGRRSRAFSPAYCWYCRISVLSRRVSHTPASPQTPGSAAGHRYRVLPAVCTQHCL